jgi:hypothetical protein
MAAAASPRAVNGYRVTFLETRDAFSELSDPACIFMAEREFFAKAKILFHHVQV